MRWLRNLFSRRDGIAHDAAPAGGPAATPASAAAPADDAPEPLGWVSHQRVSPEGPVAIAVDLSLDGRAPLGDRPRLVRVRCALKVPRTDGLPAANEAEALARVEDLLTAALAPAGAVYAGRVTAAGRREHLFYLPEGAAVAPALEALGPQLADYALEPAEEEDAGWQAYREELFPTPRTHRWLLDRRAVEALARRGDAVEVARPIDHQASFPSDEAREAFAAEAAGQGFEPVARRDDGPPPNGFGVDLRRDDPVALRHLHAVSWGLCELAARHGGGYDGWEAGRARAG
jgi:hypothetical protein